MIQRQLRLARSHFLQAFVFIFQDFQVCIHPTCPKRWFLRAHFLLIFDPAAPWHKQSKKKWYSSSEVETRQTLLHRTLGKRRYLKVPWTVTSCHTVLHCHEGFEIRSKKTYRNDQLRVCSLIWWICAMSLSRFAWIKWPWKSRCAWPVAEAVCFRRMRLQLLEVWNVKFKSGLQQALQKLRVDTGWQTTPPKRKRQRFLSRRVVTWIHRIWLRIQILTARFYQQRACFFRINLESKGWGGSTTNTVKNRDQGLVTVSFGVAWVMDRKAWFAKTHGRTSFCPSCRYFSLRFLRLTSLDGRLLDSKKTLEEESIEDRDSISAIVQTPRSLWLLKMFESFLWISRNMWRQLQ